MPAQLDHPVDGTIPVPDPTKLTTEAVDRAKAEIEKLFDVKLRALREEVSAASVLMNEKFAGRDTALDAALKYAQDLGRQQNDSNSAAISKSESATAKQLDSLNEKIDDLKQRIAQLSERNWSAVGAYIVGAAGIAAFIASVLIK